jgi:transposase-like protein
VSPLPEFPHNPKREKNNGKQNYRCSRCGHPFIADHEKTYNGCLSWTVQSIKMMLVRGMGIRDVSAVLKLSAGKVLKVLESCSCTIKPKRAYYDRLEIDEFWTYVIMALFEGDHTF